MQEAASGCSTSWGCGSVSFTCFTSRRTASRLWESPSCRMLSLDLARCSGVLPARSKASTLAPAGARRESEGCLKDWGTPAGQGQAVTVREETLPPRSSVVMTGTWFVQAAGEGKHRTHSSEVAANSKISAQVCSSPLSRGKLLSVISCSSLDTLSGTNLGASRGRGMDFP